MGKNMGKSSHPLAYIYTVMPMNFLPNTHLNLNSLSEAKFDIY